MQDQLTDIALALFAIASMGLFLGLLGCLGGDYE